MRRAAKLFEGRHDFTSFCENPEGQESTLVVVEKSEVLDTGDEIHFRITASHYLWKMVRRLAGALVEVGPRQPRRGRRREAAAREVERSGEVDRPAVRALSRRGPLLSADAWNPDQYARFAAERSQPFYDLLALVSPIPGGRAVDLGCGTGELTAELHRRTGAAETLGLDSSEAMLAKAAAHAGGGLRFERGDIARVRAGGSLRPRLLQRRAPLGARPSRAARAPDAPRRAGRPARVPGAGQLRTRLPSRRRSVAAEEPFAARSRGRGAPAARARAGGVLRAPRSPRVRGTDGAAPGLRAPPRTPARASSRGCRARSCPSTAAALPEPLYGRFVERYREPAVRGGPGRAPVLLHFPPHPRPRKALAPRPVARAGRPRPSAPGR